MVPLKAYPMAMSRERNEHTVGWHLHEVIVDGRLNSFPAKADSGDGSRRPDDGVVRDIEIPQVASRLGTQLNAAIARTCSPIVERDISMHPASGV